MQAQALLTTLQKDYPDFSFVKGAHFRWSPKQKRITHHDLTSDIDTWALLHEVAHASLGHTHFDTDFALLKLEIEAWAHAKKLGAKYNVNIDEEHIQDCLDTYRDWLHARAKCPTCNVVSTQRADKLYQCFNCKSTWNVPASQTCRVKKQLIAI